MQISQSDCRNKIKMKNQKEKEVIIDNGNKLIIQK